MTRLADIQVHMDSMSELRELVGAMRLLAGMRVQEAQRALPGIRSYAEAMATAIGRALALGESPFPASVRGQPRRGLILFAAEHGFVGGFNDRLLDALDAVRRPDDKLFILGNRQAALAHERGLRPARSGPMASQLSGVPEIVRSLMAAVYGYLARGEISAIEVLFVRTRAGQAPEVLRQPLLPLELTSLFPKPPHEPPLHNLDPETLIEKLGAEYVLALLTEGAVESLASENAARFATMTAAHDNVTRRLDDLRRIARQARQSEITTELLDLVTGAEALSQEAATESPLRKP